MKRYSLFSMASVMSISMSFSALGAEAPGGSGGSSHVAVSGSIVAPSLGTAVFTNPAALVAIGNSRLSLQAGSNDPMKDPNVAGLLSMGNGTFGVSAGLDYQLYDSAADDRGWAVYGLGLGIAPLNMAVGLAGRTAIKGGDGSDFSAGFLAQATPSVSLGGTATGLKDGADSYGVGIGFELMDGVSVIGDAAFDDELKNGELKPGLKLSNSFAGLSVSYGTGATAQFAKDVSASAFLRVGANSELELLYNHGGELPKYYASLSFGF
jgi:hypothetical protein